MDKVKVQIVNKSNNPLPKYETEGSAGMDIRAFIPQSMENSLEKLAYMLYSNNTVIIPTGIYVKLPVGYEFQVRPRSGLAAKHGITILNSPGTIDSDYTGEIGIIIHNASSPKFTIKTGDRIAQLVLKESPQAEFVEVTELELTDRSSGGFGSTGIK